MASVKVRLGIFAFSANARAKDRIGMINSEGDDGKPDHVLV